MGSDPTDEELMLAYAGGDLLAFETLYRRHRGTLYRFLLRTLRHRADADELFQDTWSRLIAARERYRPEAKFTTWLLQIAHNLVVDRYRRQRPQASDEETEAVFRQLDAPESDERGIGDRDDAATAARNPARPTRAFKTAIDAVTCSGPMS